MNWLDILSWSMIAGALLLVALAEVLAAPYRKKHWSTRLQERQQEAREIADRKVLEALREMRLWRQKQER